MPPIVTMRKEQNIIKGDICRMEIIDDTDATPTVLKYNVTVCRWIILLWQNDCNFISCWQVVTSAIMSRVER